MSILDNLKNINVEDALQAATSALKAGEAAMRGQVFESVGHALDAAMAFMPYEELSQHLDAAAIRRQKRLKDIADTAKFGA